MFCIAAISWRNEIHKEAPRRQLNRDLALANQVFCSAGIDEVPLIPAVCKYNFGTTVYTVFGKGFVKDFRSVENIYEIVLDADQSAGLFNMRFRGRSDTFGTATSETATAPPSPMHSALSPTYGFPEISVEPGTATFLVRIRCWFTEDVILLIDFN